MKTLLTVLVSFVFLNSSYSQIPYYDALHLSKLLDANLHFKNTAEQKDSLFSILTKYLGSTITSPTGFEDSTKNPFISKYFDINQTYGTSFSNNVSSSFASSLGGLNVTNFADGLAKFLVGRFKEELSTAFFQKFQEDIGNPKYHDIQLLFPETYKVLQKLGTDVYQFNAYLNTLRESFIKDLTNLYTNISVILNQAKYQAYFNKNPELGTIIKSSLYFVNAYAKGTHPGDVIANYNANFITLNATDNNLQNNLRSSINVSKLISASFKSSGGNDYWVSADSIRWFFQDPIRQNLYFGLLYQLTDTIHFTVDLGTGGNETKSFASILGDMKLGLNHLKDSINSYVDFVQTLASHTDEVSEYISEVKAKKKSEIDYNDYYKVFNSSLDLLQDGLSFVQLPYLHKLTGTDISDNIQRYGSKFLFVARSAGELYVDVRTKNYSSAVLNLVGIFDSVLSKYSGNERVAEIESNLSFTRDTLTQKIDSTQKKITSYKRKVAKIIKQYSSNTPPVIDITAAFSHASLTDNGDTIKGIVTRIINQKKSSTEAASQSEAWQKILKYGTFIATVAQAQNSDNVKAAIESIALPAGSYSVKQKSKWCISLNGYMGYSFDFNGGLYAQGIYAPVGFTLSKGLGKKHQWALSLFTSIIDVGAIASYRLNSGLTDTLKQEVRLESIISPSAQLVIGIPKTPIAICAGWRLTPKLFYSNQAKFVNNAATSVVNLSILVDIPIFTLFSRGY